MSTGGYLVVPPRPSLVASLVSHSLPHNKKIQQTYPPCGSAGFLSPSTSPPFSQGQGRPQRPKGRSPWPKEPPCLKGGLQCPRGLFCPDRKTTPSPTVAWETGSRISTWTYLAAKGDVSHGWDYRSWGTECEVRNDCRKCYIPFVGRLWHGIVRLTIRTFSGLRGDKSPQWTLPPLLLPA